MLKIFRGICFFLWMTLCILLVLQAPSWAQEISPSDGGSPSDVGAVGNPCRADGSCVKGAQCFKQSESSTICLQLGSVGQSDASACPDGAYFLQCDVSGSNCRLVCIKTHGSGCHLTSSLRPESGDFFLAFFLLMVVAFGMFRSVQKGRRSF